MKTRKKLATGKESLASSSSVPGQASAQSATGICFICNKNPATPETACQACCRPLRKLFQEGSDSLSKALITAIWHRRPDRRMSVVKAAVENSCGQFVRAQQVRKAAQKSIRAARDKQRYFLRSRDSKQRNGFKEKTLQLEGIQITSKGKSKIMQKQGAKSKRTKSQTHQRVPTEQVSDYAQLNKVLKQKETVEKLESLHSIAMESSCSHAPGDAYKSCSSLFCDGIGLHLGKVSYDDCKREQNRLKHYCNKYVKDLIFSNVQITHRGDSVYAWLTLTPNTSCVGSFTSTRFDDTLATVKTWGHKILGVPIETVQQFCFDKIDSTMDFEGAFLPSFHSETYKTMQNNLQKVVSGFFGTESQNFLCTHKIHGLKVARGDNNLRSCFIYNVLDMDNDVLLKVKIYDKILDLVGRDGHQKVGSRINQVLGSKREQNEFIKRVISVEETGMTRLEVSTCKAAFEKYNPMQPSVKTLWHSKIKRFIRRLETDFLNTTKVVSAVYRKLSIRELLATLGCCNQTLMAIGQKNSWVINASGVHSQHFVGTWQAFGLTSRAENLSSWEKLATFALRYAARGSTIHVILLHPQKGGPRVVTSFKKQQCSFFQPPGCNQDHGCVLILPPYVRIPIQKSQLNFRELVDFPKAVREIQVALGGKKTLRVIELPGSKEEAAITNTDEIQTIQINTCDPLNQVYI